MADDQTKRSGLELLCDVHRTPEMSYAHCHFRGPDGRVYGINEQKYNNGSKVRVDNKVYDGLSHPL